MTAAPARTEFPCIDCGYDLVGLDEAGVCPECGTPIEHSRRGDLLRFAPVSHVRRLARGASLLWVAMVGKGAALVLPQFMLSPYDQGEPFFLAMVVAAALSAWVWWDLTSAAGVCRSTWRRRLTVFVRGVSVAEVVVLAVGLLAPDSSQYILIVWLLLWGGRVVAGPAVLADLGRRARHEELCGAAGWLQGVIVVGGVGVPAMVSFLLLAPLLAPMVFVLSAVLLVLVVVLSFHLAIVARSALRQAMRDRLADVGSTTPVG